MEEKLENFFTKDYFKEVKEVEEVEEVEDFEDEDECFVRIVNSKKLNVRKRPFRTADIVFKALQGEELQVCEFMDDGEWARVHNTAGIEGYAMTQFLDEA